MFACSTGFVDRGVWLRIAKQFLRCALVRSRGIVVRTASALRRAVGKMFVMVLLSCHSNDMDVFGLILDCAFGGSPSTLLLRCKKTLVNHSLHPKRKRRGKSLNNNVDNLTVTHMCSHTLTCSEESCLLHAVAGAWVGKVWRMVFFLCFFFFTHHVPFLAVITLLQVRSTYGRVGTLDIPVKLSSS